MDRHHAIRIALRGMKGARRERIKAQLCENPALIPKLIGKQLRRRRPQQPRAPEVKPIDPWRKPCS